MTVELRYIVHADHVEPVTAGELRSHRLAFIEAGEVTIYAIGDRSAGIIAQISAAELAHLAKHAGE